MQLTVEKRDTAKKAASFRKAGFVPAVVYGRSEESTPIAIPRKEFEKVFKSAGSSTVITLKGLGEEKDALIHEVDFHAVSGEPLHADFYAIEKGQTVTVSVPLEFEGVSGAVKDMGGILVKVIHEIEMEVLPKDLPNMIHVDISKLVDLDSKIFVSDLSLPASAILSVPLDEVVAMIDTAKEEAEEAAPMDLSAIETSVERGKKEEEAPAADAE
jgi:large subunit ribosomal protein L25